MDYREQLLGPLSKHMADNLAAEVLNNSNDFEQIFQLIFDIDNKVAWRAAWACQKISEKNSILYTDLHYKQLTNCAINTKHFGVIRGCLSIINNLEVPNLLSIELLNACYDWLISSKTPIAVQALSLKLIYKFSLIEPDLQVELKAYLENFEPNELSSGMQAVRRNMLKNLDKKTKK